MSSKSEKDRQKAIQDKCQQLLNDMLRDEDNKYCVDCDAKGPRWASWNLGIFLCIRCAGIHRNLGVHISKVKSVNLDTWTPEQVVSLQQMGNSRARAVYEANLPDNFRRPQTDSPLEAFVRAKYEQKKYIAREWVPPTIPKVNWDKEIEEEEQARRRRKENKSGTPQLGRMSSASPGGHSVSSEIPAPLPKPKSSASPKPSRTFGNNTTAPVGATNTITSAGTLDLLGLDTPVGNTSSPNKGDDIFSGFLSAPPASGPSTNSSHTASPHESLKTDATGSTSDKRSAEENSFFNQPAASAQEKKQLTKDSILALYASAPSSGTAVQPPATQTFGGFAGFGSAPAPNMGMNFPVSNGMLLGQSIPTTASGPQNGVFGAPPGQLGMMTSGSAVSSNPFFNMTPMPANHTNPQSSVNQGHGNISDLLDLGVNNTSVLSQLPQQLNMLSLSGNPGAPVLLQGIGVPNAGGNPWANSNQAGVMGMSQPSLPQNQASLGHTLATNLWQ